MSDLVNELDASAHADWSEKAEETLEYRAAREIERLQQERDEARRESDEWEGQFLKLVDEAEKMQQRIAELVNPWISVDDRLPNKGEYVLSWDGKRRVIDVFKENGSENFAMQKLIDSIDSESPETRPVTHWMPLPQPPSGDKT